MKTNDAPTETEAIRAEFWPVWNLIKPQGLFRTPAEAAAADHAAWVVFHHLRQRYPKPVERERTHCTPATIAMTTVVPPPPPITAHQET